MKELLLDIEYDNYTMAGRGRCLSNAVRSWEKNNRSQRTLAQAGNFREEACLRQYRPRNSKAADRKGGGTWIYAC